jgi:DoxX-like family
VTAVVDLGYATEKIFSFSNLDKRRFHSTTADKTTLQNQARGLSLHPQADRLVRLRHAVSLNGSFPSASVRYFVVQVVHEVVGVPLHYFPLLAACEIAGAVGLVLGIWWLVLGMAAGVGLVVYFGGRLSRICVLVTRKEWDVQPSS